MATREGHRSLRTLSPLTGATILIAIGTLPLIVLGLEVTDTSLPPLATILLHWALAGLVVGIAVYGEELSLAGIGARRPGWIDAGYLLGTALVALAIYALTPPLIEAIGLPVETGGTVDPGVGLGVGVALAVTTGIVEEVLYRGYPIERLLEHTGSPLVAGGLTWLGFTAAHAVSWPLGNLLQTALVAALLTVVYLQRRTLVPVVGAHVLVLVFGVLGQIYG